MKPDRERDVPTAVLGGFFVLFGALSLWEARRITAEYRKPGAFDVLGPDNFLLGLGVVLTLLGALMVFPGLSRPRSTGENPPLLPFLPTTMLAMVCAYSAAMPFAGYLLATALFFPPAFWLLGIREWRRSLAASAAALLLFHLLFIRFADMPLPRGVVFAMLMPPQSIQYVPEFI